MSSFFGSWRTDYDKKSPYEIAEIVKKSLRQSQLNWAGAEGTIECVVLNACETEGFGEKLREIGVPHVVCWRSIVQDATATQFYKTLDKIHPAWTHAWTQEEVPLVSLRRNL